MTKAEELLASLAVADHTHDVVDDDAMFVIDPVTHAITNVNGEKTILIRGEHNAQRLTFKMPRYIEGHDMALCNVVQVAYINIETEGRDKKYNTGVYLVSDLAIVDDETLTLSWLVSKNATKWTGAVNFMILFSCMEGKKVTYRWPTDTYTDVYVLESVDSNLIFEDEYLDVIEQWKEAVRIEFSQYIEYETTRYGEAMNASLTKAIDERFAEIATSINAKHASMNSELDVLKGRMDTFTALPEGSTTGDAELADIRVGTGGVAFPTAGDAVRTQIAQLSEAMGHVLVENIYDPSVQTQDTITDNGFIQAGSIISNGNYFVTAPIDVSRFVGKTLYFNMQLYGYAVEAARVSSFDANGEYITNEGLDDRKYAVPTNASYIRLTVYKNVCSSIASVNEKFMILTSDITTPVFPFGYKVMLPEPSYEKLYKMAIDIKNSVINVTAASGSKYLHYVIKYFSGSKNGFFDFASIGLTSEKTAFPNGEQIIFSNGSDFLGPYIVKASGNINGDMPDSLNFTGASHAYSGNTDGSTSATGRSIIDKILVDGKLCTEFNGYCNTLDVYWTNYVQATNTKKEDGTGREVIKEQYHLHFDGEKFDIENDITALEDIAIVRYYGLQVGQGVAGYNYDISYIGSRANVVSSNGNTNSSDNKCREIYITRKDVPAECRFGLYPIGLGEFYGNNSYSAFDTDYGKSYFYMINPDAVFEMFENQQVNFKGYYKFRYCE